MNCKIVEGPAIPGWCWGLGRSDFQFSDQVQILVTLLEKIVHRVWVGQKHSAVLCEKVGGNLAYTALALCFTLPFE